MRLLLLLVGLAVMSLVLIVALVLLVWWLLRSMGALLTGRPVVAWRFEFKRYTPRQAFGRGGRRPRNPGVIDVEAVDLSDGRRTLARRGESSDFPQDPPQP